MKMKKEIDCIEVLKQMFEAADNHLSVSSKPEAQAHLEECSNCQKLLKLDKSVRERVRKTFTAETVPPGLKTRITQRIEDLENLSWKEKLYWLLPGRPWGWLGSASVMIIVLLAIGLWTLWPAHSQFVGWCFKEHAEYVEEGFILDITSSNPDAVDDWFVKNFGISPGIERFQKSGWTLFGGKKMEFAGRASALGCMKKDEVWVSLYALPTLAVEIEGLHVQKVGDRTVWAGTSQGMAQIVWKDGQSGVTYSLVAQLPLGELEAVVSSI